MAKIVYQTSVAEVIDDFQVCLPFLHGGTPADKNHVIHCAEDLVTYATGKFFPDPAVAALTAEPFHALKNLPKAVPEHFAKHLDTLKAGGDLTAINWGQLLMQLIEMLVRIFVGGA